MAKASNTLSASPNEATRTHSRANDFNDSEFTGPNFSSDAQILYANIQTPGFVLAITGPWR